MILVIGEILFDIFPDSKRFGGAPFNFAYHLKYFGFPVRFISKVGNDENGREILDRIKAAGFDPIDIQRDSLRPTGTVQVHLDKDGIPTFDIVPNVAYDFIDYLPETSSTLMDNARLIYFGTLVQRTPRGFSQAQQFLDHTNTDCLAFYDINLRPGCYSPVVIKTSLDKTDILKLNSEELGETKRMHGSNQTDAEFIQYLIDEYELTALCLTKGDDGSELYSSVGTTCVASQPVDSLVDTVGAGDAYAAMLAAGMLKKWPVSKTLSMAAEFASRICGVAGALPESAEFYVPYRNEISGGG